MIIHIFTAEKYHLVPDISQGFIKYFPDMNSMYILFCSKKIEKQKYVDLYSGYNFVNYKFCFNLLEYIRFLWQYRKNPILFHNGSYHWFLIAFFLGCKNVSWVCWGSGASIGKSFIGRYLTPLKKFIYNRFNTIITLMDDDKRTISQNFNVNQNNIKTIPYIGVNANRYASLFSQLIDTKKESKTKPLILLGNNSCQKEDYIKMLKILEMYKGKIRVQCMLHYSLVKDSLYYKLLDVGNSIFGEDFRSNEEFYNFEDYIHYMNRCDIYICNNKEQTGLGAISICLRLGKKIYITGKNYNWISQYYGAIIFNTDSLLNNLKYEEFIKELSMEEKHYNKLCIDKKNSDRITKWADFLNNL